MADINQYPLTKFHFRVEWGGQNGSFQEVTGLAGEIKSVTYRSGDDKSFIKQQIPGMKSFGALTLKRGTFPNDIEFFKWWNSSPPERRDLVIQLLNTNHNPVMTWKIIRAFPTKVNATDLNANNDEVAIESIELVHEGIEMIEQ